MYLILIYFYKTILCKHYDSPQGCSYGDKCQFAHGRNELRFPNDNNMPSFNNKMNNNQKNSLNYKIAKCKNWEQDGTCKYGMHCTFAHGDSEMRNKNDNLYQMQPGMGLMMQPFMVDMNAMLRMNQLQDMDIAQIQLLMGIQMSNNLQQQTNDKNNQNI